VRKEARTLTEAGCEVTVLAVLDPGVTPREETVQGFRIVRISRSVLGISRREMAAVKRRRATGPDTKTRRGGPGSATSPYTPPLPPPRARGGARGRGSRLLEALLKSVLFPLRRVLVFLRFVRAALRTRADVYHAHDLNTLLVAWTASRLHRKPLVYDTHEVAKAVNALLADLALRERMAERARQSGRRYSWEQEEAKLVELYAGILADWGSR